MALDLAPAENRVLLIGCGAVAREILSVIEHGGLNHLELKCLPADLHMQPTAITEAVRKTIHQFREDYASIFVIYGDCGTGGQLDAMLQQEGVERIPGPHCYSFFTGNEIFDSKAEDDITTFYLTDFLARQFDSFVVRPLGLHRWPELVSSYFGHYEKLVYLAQSDDSELDRRAEAAAMRLGLRYERRFTGYGDLGAVLADRFTPPYLPDAQTSDGDDTTGGPATSYILQNAVS
ncbi:MAG: DUF1638 domain-containing protein [Hyphomicrobiaceae bacterium]